MSAHTYVAMLQDSSTRMHLQQWYTVKYTV